jgi:hypothetical protein
MREKIKKICSSYLSSIETSDGEANIQIEHLNSNILSANGIEPHLLSLEELVIFGAETAKRSIYAGVTFTDVDHHLFWSWAGALLTEGVPMEKEDDAIRTDSHLRHLFHTTVRYMLPRQNAINEKPNSYPMINRPEIIASHLSFTLLEAICLKICSEHVAPNGDVIKKFKVSGKELKPADKCSNVGTLLQLCLQLTKNETVKKSIGELLARLAKIHNENFGSSLIFALRNKALHRGETDQSIGVSILTISILLSLQLIEQHFDHYKPWIQRTAHNYLHHPMHLNRLEYEYFLASRQHIPCPPGMA